VVQITPRPQVDDEPVRGIGRRIITGIACVMLPIEVVLCESLLRDKTCRMHCVVGANNRGEVERMTTDQATLLLPAAKSIPPELICSLA